MEREKSLTSLGNFMRFPFSEDCPNRKNDFEFFKKKKHGRIIRRGTLGLLALLGRNYMPKPPLAALGESPWTTAKLTKGKVRKGWVSSGYLTRV